MDEKRKTKAKRGGRPEERLKLDGPWEDRATDFLRGGPMPKDETPTPKPKKPKAK